MSFSAVTFTNSAPQNLLAGFEEPLGGVRKGGERKGAG